MSSFFGLNRLTVLIPLDYYQILGLPFSATREEIENNYHDRQKQEPRSEYSPSAITSRNELLKTAYEVLINPHNKAEYDQLCSRTSHRSPSDGEDNSPNYPVLDISPEQLPGAVVILYELAHYEEILTVCLPLLEEHRDTEKAENLNPDLILAVGLSFLEVAAEQWGQKEYENAAISLETGLKIPLLNKLFPKIYQELQRQLDKLCPYRIQYLLSLPNSLNPSRELGLKLFEELLIATISTDNSSKIRFGLSKDKVLQFIDRTRCHLTTTEQQILFENQAKRSSKVVYVYLSIYALIARGFAYRRPELIHRAQELLVSKLGQRRDVNLEHSLCALLLGDTVTATDLIKKSQEEDVLREIKQHSHGEEDLLPGLCWYTEHWLKTQVFPHFRDLLHQSASLDHYFANSRVQEYLENLPDDLELSFGWTNLEFDDTLNPPLHPRINRLNLPQLPNLELPQTLNLNAGGSASIFEERNKPHLSITTNSLPYAERISPDLAGLTSDKIIPFDPNLRKSRRTSAPTADNLNIPEKTNFNPIATSNPINGDTPGALVPINNKSLVHRRSPKTGKLARRKRKLPLKFWVRLVLLTTVGTAVIWLLVAIVGNTVKWAKTFTQPTVKSSVLISKSSNQPSINNNSSLSTAIESPTVTPETAKIIVQEWLKAKSISLQPDYSAERLEKIATKDALIRAQIKSKDAKAQQISWKYDHQVEIIDVQIANPPTSGIIKASVMEKADFYLGQKLNRNRSYQQNFKMKYSLIRQNDRWYIQDTLVEN